jgi:putative heme-binding domain-containing protein
VVGALKHPAAGVRRNAVQVLAKSPASVRAILNAKLLSDTDAQVRLAALLALADQPAAPLVGEVLVEALNDPTNAYDRWIPQAATCAAANNSDSFLKALTLAREPSGALIATATIVAEHRARSGPHDTVDALVEGMVASDVKLADAVVSGLARGWPKDCRPKLSASAEEGLLRLADRLPTERRATLVQLAAAWQSTKLERYAADVADSYLKRVADESLPDAQRIEAARGLIAFRVADAATATAMLDLVTPRTSPELSAGLLRALEQSESADVGRLIVERLPSLAPSARAAGISVLLGRPSWTTALIAQAEQGRVQVADLSLDQRQALAQHPNPLVRLRAEKWLQKGGALPNADRKKVVDDLLKVTKVRGDAAAGKIVFTKQCSKCHVHGSLGQRVGPDLTGMAVHPKEELLGNILDPSRSVEGNFRVYTVTTTAGHVLNGLLAAESKTSIELFDSEGKNATILREDIEQLAASTKSLMPEGFEKQISERELTDLLEFLTERGKYLPLPIEKAATAVSTRGMFYGTEAQGERLVFDDWKPKTFAGIPFQLVDPAGDRVRNAIVLYGPLGTVSASMPRAVQVSCHAPAKAIHLLSGVSGWGYPLGTKGSVSLIVRLHYDDGPTEDHPLKNGEQFADYIRRVDVPGSQFAFDLAGRQIRYLAIAPARAVKIDHLELIKGTDETAPVVMAITLESP